MIIKTLRRPCGLRSSFVLILLLCALSVGGTVCAPDFTFIQVSDTHFPHCASEATFADLVKLGDIFLKPYNITAHRPSFVICTGDMTEFGPKGGAWDAYNRVMFALGLPHYPVLGNHDNTWRALSYEIAQQQGADHYSWNNFGCHFVVLRSAAIQDPRPLIEPQQLEWLKRDLQKVGPKVPVFVAFHHPLDTREFSSPYDTDRLVEVLRPYNIAAILVGHSHSIVRKTFGGMDMIRGGSTWGPCTPGCMVYSVINGRLRVAYKPRGVAAATIPILDKALACTENRLPPVEILSPRSGEAVDGELTVIVRRTAASEGKEVTAEVDGIEGVALKPNAEGVLKGQVSLEEMAAGVHYVRVTAALDDSSSVSDSVSFRIVKDSPRAVWSAQMLATSKSTPALSESVVYLGANDGWVRAYDRESGQLLWRFRTGGAVTAEPLLLGGNLYFGSQDTNLYCVSADHGYLVWKTPASAPVYSSCVTDGKSVYFGDCDGAFHSVDAVSGKVNWTNKEATYTVESKPFLWNGKVYYGAWDNYVYCLDSAEGRLVWKCMGQGSAEGLAPAYFSPADCGPVVCRGKVFVADRKFRLSLIDAETGKLEKFFNNVSAVALSTDGESVYARKLDGRLDKLNPAGDIIWSTACQMDDMPAAPCESDGVVYVSSKRGLVSAVTSTDGKVLWQYQATPQSYVFAGLSAEGGTAYVSAADGSLTAIRE